MNDGLPVDPACIPGNRNGNDLLEDSLEEEMVWMPSTRVTDEASNVPDNVSGQPQAIPVFDKPTIPACNHEVPRPPEEIPPAPVLVRRSSKQKRPPMRYGDPISLPDDVDIL